MSARKRVEKFIKDHELEPNYQTAAYRSFDTDDLRAALKLAREAAELRRRVRLAQRATRELLQGYLTRVEAHDRLCAILGGKPRGPR